MSLEIRRRHEPPRDPAQVVVLVVAGLVMAGAGVAFAVAVLRDAGVTAAGTALALGAGAGAVLVRRAGAAAWPQVEAAEPRELGEDDDDGDVVGTADVGGDAAHGRRRTVLRRGVLAATGAVLLAALAPLTSLGPRRTDRLGTATGWADGVRVVDQDGRPLRPADISVGGLSTAWPERTTRRDVDPVVLVRLGAAPRPPTDLASVVDGDLVAYSKLCTHMGCPVGLLQEGTGSLFCPCHQAHFDANRGARPLFGPPSRPLPQLPLGVDADGHLIATGDFPEPVGPTTGRSDVAGGADGGART